MPTFEHLELFERWRPAVGYEGCYVVSDWGRVMRLPPSGAYTKGRLLKGYRPKGYTIFHLRNPKTKQMFCHVLVAEAFLGPCPSGMEVDHVNRDRSDNRLINLRYVTRHQNNGGENNGQCKLTDFQIAEIRRLSLEGVTQRQISQLFNISNQHVSEIVRHKTRKKVTWKDFSQPQPNPSH